MSCITRMKPRPWDTISTPYRATSHSHATCMTSRVRNPGCRPRHVGQRLQPLKSLNLKQNTQPAARRVLCCQIKTAPEGKRLACNDDSNALVSVNVVRTADDA